MKQIYLKLLKQKTHGREVDLTGGVKEIEGALRVQPSQRHIFRTINDSLP